MDGRTFGFIRLRSVQNGIESQFKIKSEDAHGESTIARQYSASARPWDDLAQYKPAAEMPSSPRHGRLLLPAVGHLSPPPPWAAARQEDHVAKGNDSELLLKL